MDQTELLVIWEDVLEKVKKSVPDATYKKWLLPLKPMEMSDEKLILGVSNDFAKEWITERYLPLFTQAIFDTTKKDLVIELVKIRSNDDTEPTDEAKNATPKIPAKRTTKKNGAPIQTSLIDADTANFISGHEIPSPIAPGDSSSLNLKYTFDTFVTGKSNQFAHAAALAVAASPGKVYNPFFMYGGVGLGKTHLMHAIGHHILNSHPEMRVLYVSSEKFTNELINSIRDGNPDLFRQKYRNIDVLLVDDIQFLTGKQSTQEEFFHTFNTLRDTEKQIILSSDRPPREVKDLEERLRSRFEWGLITDIQAPDLETRIAILKKKALIDRLNVPNDVMVYIASRIDSNIRELEGALTRVVAFASLSNQPVTTELVSETLQDIFPQGGKKEISIDLIKDIVADFFKVKVEDFESKKRTREIAYPRQIAMYLSRELTSTSLPQIGSAFGGRDHTTVIHACEKIRNDCGNDTKVQNTVNELMERLQRL